MSIFLFQLNFHIFMICRVFLDIFYSWFNHKKPRRHQSRRYDSATVVLQVSSEVHWHVTETQAPLSVIDWLTALLCCLPFSSCVPHTSVLSLASDTTDSLITLLVCTALQRTTEDYSERRREREGKGRMERKHSSSLFFSLWHLA